mgnify:CR=1 FL=1
MWEGGRNSLNPVFLPEKGGDDGEKAKGSETNSVSFSYMGT